MNATLAWPSCSLITFGETSAINEMVAAVPKEPRPFLPDQISCKSDLISDWFSSQHGLLRKYGVVISMVSPGHYRIGTWRVDDAVIYVP